MNNKEIYIYVILGVIAGVWLGPAIFAMFWEVYVFQEPTWRILGAILGGIGGWFLAGFITSKDEDLPPTPGLDFWPLPPVVGVLEKDSLKSHQRVEWTVNIRNMSQVPISVARLVLNVRLRNSEDGKQTILTSKDAHVSEPSLLRLPVDVTLANPLGMRWVIEGSSAGNAFDYVRGISNKREFELICYVFYSMAPNPDKLMRDQIVSEPFNVSEKANWSLA